MEELYALIEEKIKASGCPLEIDGRSFYNMVSDEAEDKDNGAYIIIFKMDDEISCKGTVDILDDDLDLHTVDIYKGDQSWHVDFDA